MIQVVGPGGAGKTTVGRALAERLGIAFVDLDEQFAARAGDISAYLTVHGYQAYAARNVQIYLDTVGSPPIEAAIQPFGRAGGAGHSRPFWVYRGLAAGQFETEGSVDAIVDGLVAHLSGRRKEASVTTAAMKPRVTSLAPQFLVDDLERSIAYYRKLGFTFGEPWGGFYAIGDLDGLELHLKEAPKNHAERRHRRDNEHVDASAGVDGIEAFYEQCVGNGATILKPLTATAWGTKDFYIEDPDGYIICFGGRPAAGLTSL